MDSTEATKVVINKISQLEPDHIARKIIGFMFFQELSDQEMIRLALGPDSLIHNLIQRAKTSHVISPPAAIPDPSFPFPPYSTRPFPSQAAFGRMDHYWDHHSPVEQQKLGFKIVPDYEEQLEAGFSSRGGRNSPVKTCHYFIQGFCKHGSNCRYYHDESARESYLLHNLGPNHNPNPEDDPGYSPGSLENLELEIVELLKSRRGFPVSIASLPMMYYEAYGKTLQAEGYLTESQRHGKAGYSLTKLLARLKNSIRLIDRPHGQHSVILSEDFAKYMEFRAQRNDPGPVVTGSRQIYLTFPADSTFTEEDVSNYFNNFGIVNDVRIPSQQKRMFGFVTFASADTVRLILNKGNPHFVCNARVLVKPYREKSKLVERKYLEKFDHPGYYHSHPTHFDSSELQNNFHLGCGFHLLMAGWELTRQARMQLLDEHENAVELEAMRLSQLQLAGKPMASRPWLGYSTNELNMIQDRSKFSSSGRVNHLLDVLHNGSPSDDNSMYPVTSWGDQESGQRMSLPDSPFAPPAPSSIPAVI